VPDNESRCARCGGDFHCGANDAAPCACTSIALDAATLASLRERFAGCLCLACLREIQRDASTRADPPSA
jgi:Cysteine-rich CWC